MKLLNNIISAIAAIALAMLLLPAGAYALEDVDSTGAGDQAGIESTIDETPDADDVASGVTEEEENVDADSTSELDGIDEPADETTGEPSIENDEIAVDDGDDADESADACAHDWGAWSYTGFDNFSAPLGYVRTCSICGDQDVRAVMYGDTCVDGGTSHRFIDDGYADHCYMPTERPIMVCADCGKPEIFLGGKDHDWSIYTDEYRKADHPNSYGDWYQMKLLCANDPAHEKWIYTPDVPEEPQEPQEPEEEIVEDPVPEAEPELVDEPVIEDVVEPEPVNYEIPPTGDVAAATAQASSIAFVIASIALVALMVVRRKK